MSHDSPNAEREGSRLRGRDLLIIGAAGIVSLALGRGLYDQVGLDAPAAGIGGFGLFVILAFVHLTLRKMQRLGRIEPQLHELDHRKLEARRPPQPAPGRRPAGQQPGPGGRIPPQRGQRPVMQADGAGMTAGTAGPMRGSGSALPAAGEVANPNAEAADPAAPEIGALRGTLPDEAAASPQQETSRPRVDVEVVDDLVRALAGELGRSRTPPADAVANDAVEPAVSEDETIGAGAQEHPVPHTPQVTDPLGLALLSAVDTGEIEIFLQPVMSLADRKPRLYEVFPRIRVSSQELATPAEFMPRAEQLGIAREIERAMLRRVHTILTRLAERGRARVLFCNISRHLLSTPPAMLDLFEIMKATRATGELLILELSQSDYQASEAVQLESLRTLAQLGFRFSMDQVQSMPVAVERLAASGFAFVKLTPAVLAASGQTSEEIARMLAAMRQAGIEPIMEGIDHGGDVGRLPAIGLQLGQGDALSEAHPVRAELLSPTKGRDGSAVA